MAEVTGTIRLIGETQLVGSNGFSKRLIVIDTNEQYVQSLPIDFVKEKCDLLDNFNPGESVKISINIRGNEYNGKYYCSLQGWQIYKQDQQQGGNQGSAVDNYQRNQQAQQQAPQQYNQEDDGDLPF